MGEEVLQWTRALAMQAGLRPTLECAKSFSFTDFRGDLPAFRVPTLVVHGTADKTVPIDATGRRAAGMIAGATLKEYDDAPHGLTVTHKQELTADLLELLKG